MKSIKHHIFHITIIVLLIIIFFSSNIAVVAASTSYRCSVDDQKPNRLNSRFFGVAASRGLTDEQFNQTAMLFGQAGVGMVSRNIHWDEVEKNKGDFRWGSTDANFQALANQGIRPLARLNTTATWASSRPNDPNAKAYPPQNIDDWKNFVRQAVRRYGVPDKNIIKDWEIWNEPDLKEFFLGAPDDYIALLNTAYTVIKQEDPKARVWGPTTIYAHYADPGHDKFKFTKAAIERGKMDVFSVHIYGTSIPEIYNRTKKIRQYLNENGRQSIPLALTESNLSGPYVGGHCPYNGVGSELTQPQTLTDIYLCNANAGANYVFWYRAYDTLAPTTICPDGQNRNGILRRDLSIKPSYTRLKELVAAFVPTPSPTPTFNPADLNQDGKVDIYDYNILVADFGKTGSPGWIKADIIKDGKVDIYDYNVLVGNFGQ